MSEEKVRDIDVEKFIFTKLYEEYVALDKVIEEKTVAAMSLEEEIKDARLQIETLEKKLYSLKDELSVLKGNKVKLKNKHEEVKRVNKF